MLFMNMFLLFITTVLLYLGYVYKGILFFLVSMIFEDTRWYLYKLSTPKMNYDEQLKIYKMSYFIDNLEYILVIDENELKSSAKDKIMAFSNSRNQTDFLLKIMGPNKNFHGYKITPNKLGFENLTIWKDKKKYFYNEKDNIVFNEKYIKLDSDSSEDLSETEI